MNHMDPDTKIVHIRLEAWGRWSRDAQLRPFPSVSVIGRMMEYGALGAAQEGRPPVSMPDDIAAVDAAVARLWGIGKAAVVRYYTHSEPISVSARECRMKARQFQHVLNRARHLIGMWLQL